MGPSTLRPGIEEGSTFCMGPSTLERYIVEGSMPQDGTFHAEGPNQGRSWAYTTKTPLKVATTDRQAGLTRSPAQSCRVVTAGDALFR
ncbi:MAG: hypothetical protein ACI4UJ_08255, partial [Candidatus Cryptobacteroides sp.]